MDPYLMPITRRLPASAIPVVQAFYPGHPFTAWTLPGVRRMRLLPGIRGGQTARSDTALDVTASEGWAWVRLLDTPGVERLGGLCLLGRCCLQVGQEANGALHALGRGQH